MRNEGKSPADMLTAAGECLHGRDWQAALARDLGMNPKNIQRWLSGRTALPADHGLFDDLAALLHRRAQEIAAQAGALDRWIKAARQ